MILSDRDPFSAKAWQEFLNQFSFLTEHGLTIDDVRETIALKRQEQEKQIKNSRAAAAKALKKCPECAYPLQLLPVNDTLATQTGDGSKSVWICRHCHYEQFSTRSIKEELNVTP
jgi:hypothetical protein